MMRIGLIKMLYKDMSIFIDDLGRPRKNIFNVGWLDRGGFASGDVDYKYVEKLKILSSSRVSFDAGFNVERGFCNCPVCDDGKIIKFSLPGKESFLGRFVLLIPSVVDGEYFASPSLILHYIEFHGYKPPKIFLDSLGSVDLEEEFDAQSLFDSMSG